ncbi:NAD-dependent protein deacylase [Bacillus massiliigorillae]|uniref:NAD-dependent protein deacylase n=1 Tax=Bacillus massiliigorillae TaxID=1243664 RepID=UPI00039EC307|nr:NAD-dependent protein deacylase [Bacillus massiliigorillae]
MLKEVVDYIRDSKYIVVLTGAGISTESGLPDFRSNGGLWDGKKPEEISHSSAVGSTAFKHFFTKRIVNINEHKPNNAHEILADWEAAGKVKAIVTQNIDSFHQDAGSKRVIEMHGHLRNLKCNICGTEYNNSKYLQDDSDECEVKGCKGIVRPEVVLFGEYLPEDAWFQANEEISKADLVMVLGTSLQVFPFNTLVESAYSNGAKIVLITKSETPFDYVATVRIHDSIGKVLKEISCGL